MVTTPNKPPTPVSEVYRILQYWIQKGGQEAAAKAQAYILAHTTKTLEDYYASPADDDEKRLHFRHALNEILHPDIKAQVSAVKQASAEELFAELTKLQSAAKRDVQIRLGCHIRAVTGKLLVNYHSDRGIPEIDKVLFYSECIAALKSGDYSKFQGQVGVGDKRVDPVAEAAAAPKQEPQPEPEPEPAKPRAITPKAVQPEPETEEEDEDTEAMLLKRLLERKKQPKVDEAAIRRIAEEVADQVYHSWNSRLNIPDEEDIKEVVNHMMGNGGFPVSRVESIIDAKLKAFTPDLGMDAKVDAMLSMKLAEFLKIGPAALAASTKPTIAEDGELASYIPEADPAYVVAKEMRAFLKHIHGLSRRSPINVMVVGPHGCGKCLAKGTPVLMFDGTTKKVEDIVPGDLVMGPDSAPRRVESLARGKENMWRVIPTKGDPYVVNESHILSLRHCTTKKVVNISVRDYLKSSKEFKTRHLGWRAGVEFAVRWIPESISPYFLGVWLGDGSAAKPSIHKPDQEINQAVQEFAASVGCRVSTHLGKSCPEHSIIAASRKDVNPVLTGLRSLGLLRDKHVPDSYKLSTKQVRLEVLAGLMDTDGHLSRNTYDYISKSKRLADDVVFMARSVGLAAYMSECTKSCQGGFSGTYYRVCISGNTDMIPCRIKRKKATPRRQRKDVLSVGIKLEPVGYDEYFGFTLSGPDRLFLLGDFTVTHNTTLAEILAAEYKMPCLIMDCANIREPRDWFGYKYTDSGTVKWHRSQFDRCISAGNHVIVLDEIARTTDMIRNTLFPLLDYRRRTYLEERGDYITVGPNTIIMVTLNEGMAYTGCSTLDIALDDRCTRRIEVNYLSVADETEVLVKRTGIDRPAAKKLAELADEIRHKAVGMGAVLTKTISTRRLIEAAEDYKALGVNGLTYSISNHFTAEGGDESERAKVLLLIQGKFGTK